jgi:poly(3-hydroxybutyrate) depolymerase
MSLNLGRHCDAYRQYVADLFAGADDKARQHETFYHEYLSVMDMDAVFYLETIEKVFQEHHLPTGRFVSGGRLVDPAAITATALLTIEGEKDDITGLGQTEAAHGLCPNVPFRRHITVAGAGHYGIFSGRRFRDLVAPAIKDMIRLLS